jgi:hypothetical protein
MVRNVAEPLTGKHRSSKLYHPILNFSIQISERVTTKGILQAETRIVKLPAPAYQQEGGASSRLAPEPKTGVISHWSLSYFVMKIIMS